MIEKIMEEIEEATRQEDAPIYCGNMEVDGYVRMSRVEEIIRKHMNDDWIPCAERMPEDNKYILLSFENFSLPEIGRYEAKEDGGAFYLGECDEGDTCISQDLYVNAWQPLPEPYRPEKGRE